MWDVTCKADRQQTLRSPNTNENEPHEVKKRVDTKLSVVFILNFRLETFIMIQCTLTIHFLSHYNIFCQNTNAPHSKDFIEIFAV